MINRKLIHTILILTILGVGLSFGQWQIYDCSVLPAEADTAWHEYGSDNPDDIPELISVVDDTAIAGNKLIKVDSDGPGKETWRYAWNSDRNVGATLVMRGVDLDASAYDRGFDVYIQNGIARERFVTKAGKSIDFNKSGASTSLNTTEWHIYRITIIDTYLELYVDEDPIPYLGANGDLESPGNYIQFGDNGKEAYGCLYDWIIWDVSGAYPPGQGTPIPQELLDTGSTDVVTKDLTTPESYQLLQNYPNPFNPTTEIAFHLDQNSMVRLQIFDLKGKTVYSPINEYMQSGTYSIQWDGRNMNGDLLPSGIYFYSLEAGLHKSVKKMTLVK